MNGREGRWTLDTLHAFSFTSLQKLFLYLRTIPKEDFLLKKISNYHRLRRLLFGFVTQWRETGARDPRERGREKEGIGSRIRKVAGSGRNKKNYTTLQSKKRQKAEASNKGRELILRVIAWRTDRKATSFPGSLYSASFVVSEHELLISQSHHFWFSVDCLLNYRLVLLWCLTNLGVSTILLLAPREATLTSSILSTFRGRNQLKLSVEEFNIIL